VPTQHLMVGGQNLDAARAILEAMVRSEGPAGARDRAEAARLLALVPGAFNDLVVSLAPGADAKTVSALLVDKLK